MPVFGVRTTAGLLTEVPHMAFASAAHRRPMPTWHRLPDAQVHRYAANISRRLRELLCVRYRDCLARSVRISSSTCLRLRIVLQLGTGRPLCVSTSVTGGDIAMMDGRKYPVRDPLRSPGIEKPVNRTTWGGVTSCSAGREWLA
jgi:hypothetical protein